MKTNFAIISFKEDEAGILVKHVACYEEEPGQNEIDALVLELSMDEDFGMTEDTDFKIADASRADHPALFDDLEIPAEVGDEEAPTQPD